MTEKIVSIDTLRGNRFQPRREEDPAAVEALAENILHNATEDFDGLLQPPIVRPAGGVYDLAFGHNRLSAFRLLARRGHMRYAMMRVDVRDLSDLQMFELAVAENIKRRDLNPIEQAEAMQTYLETFEKTSAEAAQFFGVAASTVRGWVRLNNLPDPAKDKVRSGEINVGGARALLVVDKLMGAAGVETVLERMTDGEEGALEAIEHTLRFDAGAALLGTEAWVKANPFPQKHLKALPPQLIASLLIVEDESELDGLEEEVKRLVTLVQGGMEVTDEAFAMFLPDALEKVRVLANPPACVTCPLYAKFDGEQYCGLKVCADRKKEAWFSASAERVSEETGILVYDKRRDGAYAKLNMYNSENVKLFEGKQDDLRLMAAVSEVYGNSKIDLDPHVQAVVVGKTLEKLKKKDEKVAAKETEKKSQELPWQAQSQIRSAIGEIVRALMWEVAAKFFAAALEGLTNFAVLNLFRDDVSYPGQKGEDELVEDAKRMKKADGLEMMRRIVAMGIIERNTNFSSASKTPILDFGKEAAELAKELGVKLPKDWDAQVKKYQDACAPVVAEIVASWKEK